MAIQRINSGKRMSQAVVCNGMVFLAGQVAQDYDASLEVQTQQVLGKIDALLAQAGTSKARLLSVQVLLPNIVDFDRMNAVYDSWIDPANPPARACYEARLAHPSLRVEIIATAALSD